MMEKDGLLNTTVVGSFPLNEYTANNMEKAFSDQIKVGIDFPCYPQLVSMNPQFLSPLSELVEPLEEKDEKFYLNGDFKLPSDPIALEYGKFVVDYFKENPEMKKRVKGTKACLTGPFTLASEILLQGEIANGVTPKIFREPRAIMVDWIVDKLATLMKGIGKAYNEMGFNIISMDEPILGLFIGRRVMLHDEDFIIKTLNKAISGIDELSSIHVCGRISPTLRDLLLNTNCKILDHEFRTNLKNFDIFQKAHFDDTDKYLAMGTIETKVSEIENGTMNDYVEDVNFLKSYIQKGIEQFGKKNLIIKPDCGFGPLKSFGQDFGYEMAIKKLENMVKAVNQLR